MTNQVNQYERHMAIQEAYQIHDSDEYFKARPQLECGDRRKVFYAGHIRGYQAATQASESEINSLKQRVEELQANNERLREALTHADEFISNGIEFGFIRMPDDDLKGIDSAHDTPEIISKALSSTPAQSLAMRDIIEKREQYESDLIARYTDPNE